MKKYDFEEEKKNQQNELEAEMNREPDLWLVDDDGIYDEEFTSEGENANEINTGENDTNGIEITEIDSDGDGRTDIVITEVDLDGDGQNDFETAEIDLDGDGRADVITYAEDLNGDGINDVIEVEVKSDDAGSFFFRAADLDLDGNMETVSFDRVDDVTDDLDDRNDNFNDDDAEDSDEEDENEIDTEENNDERTQFEIYEEDDESPALEISTVDYDPDSDNALHYYELEHFDPDDAEKEGIIGDPEKSLEYWESQGETNRCALYSQKFVIEEYTGEEIDIDELVEIAEEEGWFSESGGTPAIYMDKLLNYYNVPNETSYNNDVNDIAENLSEGKRVIVSVDADEMWDGENDSSDVYIPGDGVNHAVEIIGIDNSDPNNPVVILNDPGIPGGCGVEVPLDTFLDAWEDGNCHMIVCM